MTRDTTLLNNLTLRGLELAPSQVCGAIRLVPVLRQNVRSDLRLAQQRYNENWRWLRSTAGTGSRIRRHTTRMCHTAWCCRGRLRPAYFRLRHTNSISCPAWQTGELGEVQHPPDAPHGKTGTRQQSTPVSAPPPCYGRLLVAVLRRAGYRVERILPPRARARAVAPLGKLVRRAIHCRTRGSPARVRDTRGASGRSGLCRGSACFAYVVPCPEDYRALHAGLLEDFYGELLYQYALLYDTTYPVKVTLDAKSIANLTQLRAALTQVRSEWAAYHCLMAGNLLGRDVQSSRVYQLGRSRCSASFPTWTRSRKTISARRLCATTAIWNISKRIACPPLKRAAPTCSVNWPGKTEIAMIWRRRSAPPTMTLCFDWNKPVSATCSRTMFWKWRRRSAGANCANDLPYPLQHTRGAAILCSNLLNGQGARQEWQTGLKKRRYGRFSLTATR